MLYIFFLSFLGPRILYRYIKLYILYDMGIEARRRKSAGRHEREKLMERTDMALVGMFYMEPNTMNILKNTHKQ